MQKRNGTKPVFSPRRISTVEEGRDYTQDILEFLRGAHGGIRSDDSGNYYYERVSTISLHFLLRSSLPAKEVLWGWYRHFEQRGSESIYQTLPPQRDEEFLDILSSCDFYWDVEAVKHSGWVFLVQHRREVYLALESFLEMRLEAFETMSEAELREVLTPREGWSDRHLKKLILSIQTDPLLPEQRRAIYDLLDSDYQKATTRHVLEDTLTQAFWKSPPPELEGLHSRFVIFARSMTHTARRLGVYLSRSDYQARGRTHQQGHADDPWPHNGARNNTILQENCFRALGLSPSASLLQVKSAYRDMVKQRHPDQGGSVEDFLQLQEAYEYLLTHVY